jgi:hypothetical protein
LSSHESGDESVRTTASLKYTSKPDVFRVLQHGDVLWESNDPAPAAAQGVIALQVTEGDAEVLVEASWSTEGPHVFEVTLAPDGMEEQSCHAWSGRRLEDVFSYHWHEAIHAH